MAGIRKARADGGPHPVPPNGDAPSVDDVACPGEVSGDEKARAVAVVETDHGHHFGVELILRSADTFAQRGPRMAVPFGHSGGGFAAGGGELSAGV